jgi:two-component system, cell cycle response regulator
MVEWGKISLMIPTKNKNTLLLPAILIAACLGLCLVGYALKEPLWMLGASVALAAVGVLSAMPRKAVARPEPTPETLLPPVASAAPKPSASGYHAAISRPSISGSYAAVSATATNPEDPFSETQNALKVASSSQFVARSLLQQQEEKDKKQLESLLGPVVEFMSAIVKPYSALAFLRDSPNSLRLNAHISRSDKLIHDAVIRDGEGLLGGLLYRTSPFTTGDVTAFGRPPEYYQEGERILGMIALPVFLGEAKDGDFPEALLVMDGQQRFKDDVVIAMRTFSKVTSALITAERSRALLSRQQIVRQVLYNVQERLARHLKADQILPILAEELANLFDYRRLVFCTWNPNLKRGTVAHVKGDALGLEPGTSFDFAQNGLYARTFRQQTAEIASSIRETPSYRLYDSEVDSRLTWVPMDVLAVPLVNDDHRAVAVLGIETDLHGAYQEEDLKLLTAIAGITSIALQKARMYAEMEKLATMDGLTGIPNHRHFQGLLSKEIEMVNRYGGVLGFLLFDIDHFKNFNDTYGHAVGDLVLKQVARCVAAASRNTDIVARYGGEEFVVVLPKSDAEASRLSADRIRAAIEAMDIPHEGKNLKVTVSIGVSTFPAQAATKQELIDNADKAMYFSKKTGRNRVSVYSAEAEALAVEKDGGKH